MKWTDFLFLPFILQGIAILADEFYFHRKRGLPQWERVAHPLDTLTVFSCYAFLLSIAPTDFSKVMFSVLSVFSCIFITKDEFIHKEHCNASENWLHAVLFILHPVCFIAAVWMWSQGLDLTFIKVQCFLVFVFMIYQIFYWRPYEKDPS